MAFAPEVPAPAANAPATVSPEGMPGEAAAGGAESLPMGMSETGRMQGVAPGQLAPGGRPDVQSLLASLGARGEANLQATVARRLPI